MKYILAIGNFAVVGVLGAIASFVSLSMLLSLIGSPDSGWPSTVSASLALPMGVAAGVLSARAAVARRARRTSSRK
jgi:putative flippase GtrA